ncbi:MAG: HAMP domain-containing sensor histidine kinase [Thermoguttaceae bacterium]|jgi:signal transduction histidine kinase
MADVSAAGLGEWLLGSAREAHSSEFSVEASKFAVHAPPGALEPLLRSDPPLALWVACMADRCGASPPASIAELAGWLAGHALESLTWEPQTLWADAADPASAEDCGRRVARAVELAELAARLAAPLGETASQRAALVGLLDGACGWLAAGGQGGAGQTRGHGDAQTRRQADDEAGRQGDEETEKQGGEETPGAVPASPRLRVSASPCLPAWLAAAAEPAVAAALDQAARTLAGEATLPHSAGIDLDDCRRRGAEARRRWLVQIEPSARWLPALVAMAGRLSALERRFAETLESEKLEAMAEFAAGAGHEINNPLTIIAGRAQLFLREETDPERRRALALMNAQAMRVHEMIADMRLFARPPRPDFQSVELVGLADRLIEELSARAAEQETALLRRGDPGPLETQADPVQLMVALRALVQNAFESLGHQGSVTVTVRRTDAGPQIAVADDGPGLTPDVRRHCFDPFYSARQAGRGLGMGLSKCWRIVRQHGGRIEVESPGGPDRPGRGATFTITLPRRP